MWIMTWEWHHGCGLGHEDGIQADQVQRRLMAQWHFQAGEL